MVDWPDVLSFHKNLSKLTVAVGIEGGIWGGQVFLQNLHLCLIVQICVCQCTTRAELSVVRVAITKNTTLLPRAWRIAGKSQRGGVMSYLMLEAEIAESHVQLSIKYMKDSEPYKPAS